VIRALALYGVQLILLCRWKRWFCICLLIFDKHDFPNARHCSLKTATATEVQSTTSFLYLLHYPFQTFTKPWNKNTQFNIVHSGICTYVNQVHLYAVFYMKCSRYHLTYHYFESRTGIFISACCYTASRATRNTMLSTWYIVLRIPFYLTICTREWGNSVVGGVRT